MEIPRNRTDGIRHGHADDEMAAKFVANEMQSTEAYDMTKADHIPNTNPKPFIPSGGARRTLGSFT